MVNHVVSLKLAKQLKEAGWKKETEFWWVNSRDLIKLWKKLKIKHIKHFGDWVLRYDIATPNRELCYPAPLAIEILEELPKKNIIITKEINQYRVRYEFDFTKGIRNKVNYRWIDFINKSLPDVLSELWLDLYKEKR